MVNEYRNDTEMINKYVDNNEMKIIKDKIQVLIRPQNYREYE